MKYLILIFTLLLSFSSFSKAYWEKGKTQSLKVQDPSFVISCSMGMIEGCSVVSKFGINPGLQSGNVKDVWDWGASTNGDVDYTYPLDGTAPIDTASSSSALDTQVIEVTGLDINGIQVIQNVTLNGQNKVTLNPTLWRSFRVKNVDTTLGADRTAGFVGNVFIYEDTPIVGGIPSDVSKVRAYIEDGNNQTQMTQYAIPAGHTGFILGGSARMAKKLAASIIFKMWQRTFGSVFRLVDNFALVSTGTGAYNEISNVPSLITEKTDIVISAESDTNGVGIAVSYDLIILKNSAFGL